MGFTFKTGEIFKFFKLKGVPDLWWDVTAISLAFVGNFELGDIPVME